MRNQVVRIRWVVRWEVRGEVVFGGMRDLERRVHWFVVLVRGFRCVEDERGLWIWVVDVDIGISWLDSGLIWVGLI